MTLRRVTDADGITRVELVQCPVCGADLENATNRAEHISTHDPEDFGLEPLRTSTPSAPTMHTTSDGYEYVRDRADGRDDTCYIHRLAFVAEYGFEALPKGYEVHHKLNIPWLNSPENLEAIEPIDHANHHLNRPDHLETNPREVINV
jgi:hypothetical protein